MHTYLFTNILVVFSVERINKFVYLGSDGSDLIYPNTWSSRTTRALTTIIATVVQVGELKIRESNWWRRKQWKYFGCSGLEDLPVQKLRILIPKTNETTLSNALLHWFFQLIIRVRMPELTDHQCFISYCELISSLSVLGHGTRYIVFQHIMSCLIALYLLLHISCLPFIFVLKANALLFISGYFKIFPGD